MYVLSQMESNGINQSAFRFRLVITDYILHQTLMTLFILLDIKLRDNIVTCDWQSLYRDSFLTYLLEIPFIIPMVSYKFQLLPLQPYYILQ